VLERSDVGLGDDADGMFKSIACTSMVAGNVWKEASRNMVAQVGGKHSGKEYSR